MISVQIPTLRHECRIDYQKIHTFQNNATTKSLENKGQQFLRLSIALAFFFKQRIICILSRTCMEIYR